MVVCVKMMSKGSTEALTGGICGLCTQYRYIQCYVKRVEKALTVLIVTHVTHVKRVESGVCGSCTQYRYIQCYVEELKYYVMLKQGTNTFLLITFLIFK